MPGLCIFNSTCKTDYVGRILMSQKCGIRWITALEFIGFNQRREKNIKIIKSRPHLNMGIRKATDFTKFTKHAVGLLFYLYSQSVLLGVGLLLCFSLFLWHAKPLAHPIWDYKTPLFKDYRRDETVLERCREKLHRSQLDSMKLMALPRLSLSSCPRLVLDSQ